MKVGIVNSTSFYLSEDGKYFLPSDEIKSLSQWFSLFTDVVLFKPRLYQDLPELSDWVEIGPEVKIVEICSSDDGLEKKWVKIGKIVRSLVGFDYFYYRIPNYESAIFYHFQPKQSPYFVEIHGDMESAVMVTNKPLVLKYCLSKILFRLFRAMSSNANFALTIGPELKRRYVRSSIPVLVTTNHLLSKSDYSQSPQIREIKNKRFELLFVGHIHARKGLMYLFEALRMLNEHEINFRMRIVGNGQLQHSLEVYATKYNFISRVEFLGQIKHGAALFDLYRDSDCFVLPSVAAEGVPRVTHEAMAFGCPVVATSIGSVEWQLDGDCGLLVEPRNSGALYEAMFSIYSNSDLRKRLIKNAYKKSLDFSIESQEERIHQFVNSQIGN